MPTYVYMHMYLPVPVHVLMYMHMYLYIYMYLHMYMYLYMYWCTWICIAGQKIVKALTFNRKRIVGLCKSLTLNAFNF